MMFEPAYISDFVSRRRRRKDIFLGGPGAVSVYPEREKTVVLLREQRLVVSYRRTIRIRVDLDRLLEDALRRAVSTLRIEEGTFKRKVHD